MESHQRVPPVVPTQGEGLFGPAQEVVELALGVGRDGVVFFIDQPGENFVSVPFLELEPVVELELVDGQNVLFVVADESNGDGSFAVSGRKCFEMNFGGSGSSSTTFARGFLQKCQCVVALHKFFKWGNFKKIDNKKNSK